MDGVVSAGSFITDFGWLGVLILVLVGGNMGWWVFGWYHRETIARLQTQLDNEKKEKEGWRQIALHGHSMATDAITLAGQQLGSG